MQPQKHNVYDPGISQHLRLPELRQLEVSPHLARVLLSIENRDRLSIKEIATRLRCSKDEVKSVLLNEQKWLESF